MVFDEITKEWVPRYGMGSVKKIGEKYNWLMEENSKHREAGMNPFEYELNKKKLAKEKQALAEVKNQMHASGADKNTNKDQILDANKVEVTKTGANLKQREEVERD